MKAIGIARIGIVAPGCRSVEELPQRLAGPAPSAEARRLTNGETVTFRPVTDGGWNQVVSSRYERRLDRFCKLALSAAQQCLDDTSVAQRLSNGGAGQVGISLGNNFGGWGYVEPQMDALYTEGMDSINPYVATAWFPAAAQGEISIRFGIKGHSKTFSAERLSAGVAMEYARLLLQEGTLDLALVGGVESPDSAVVLNDMYEQGLVSETMPAGEAACILLISPEARGCLGIVSGIGRASNAGFAMTRALNDAGLRAGDIDCIFLDRPRARQVGDANPFETQLQSVRRLYGPGASVALPQPFGETVGASMALEVAIACVAMRAGITPASVCNPATRDAIEREELALLPGGAASAISNIVVNASDQFGQTMSIIVSKATTGFEN